MQRRKFMQHSVLAGASVITGQAVAARDLNSTKDTEVLADKPFNLDYAVHDGMFSNHAGENFIDQINYAYNMGFRSIEDNGMKGRSADEQKKIGETLAKNNMRMGVFVAHTIGWDKPTLSTPDESHHTKFLQEITESVEVAKRCNAKWITVVPGTVSRNLNMHFQTARIIETLKKASAILEPHGLIMVLEPLNFRDHPNLFLTDVPQAYVICKAVASPSCKILYDMYHAQIQIGNIIPFIDEAYDEVAYYQIGDNPGRKEPTSGEMNYKNIFQHIYKKGFKGILGMEHGKVKEGKEGEIALIKAYRESDSFKV
jgi:hydroxypyruvate isomerase